MGSTGIDQSAIAVGSTATSNGDTTGLAGVSKQQNVYNTTRATNIFNITSANNTLVVNDDGGTTDTTITLAPGSYTGAQLATELASKLNASRNVANTTAYTVSYGSVTSGRFTINNPAGNTNSLLMKFGSAGSTAAQMLGSGPATVTETVGASASTLSNDAGYTTYLSGANIDFDGLRVVLQDGTTDRAAETCLVSGKRENWCCRISPMSPAARSTWKGYGSHSAMARRLRQVAICSGFRQGCSTRAIPDCKPSRSATGRRSRAMCREIRRLAVPPPISSIL